MGSIPSVRIAGVDDAEAIACVHVETWRAAYVGLIPDAHLAGLSTAARRETWVDILTADDESRGRTWVATLHGEVLGFASAGPCRDPGGRSERRWEVFSLYVGAEHWGRGLGTALLTAAIDCAPHEADEVSLWVLADNRQAIDFYARHGFIDDGGRRTQDFDGVRVAKRRLVRPVRLPAGP